MPLPERYVNKTVHFRFDGVDLRFRLSQGLFSSFDIDDGTRLLLKSIAARIDFSRLRAVLDVGCGVGVLGICVGARAPQARVTMRDRDALAVAFAAANASENGIAKAVAAPGLGLQGLGQERFDLIVSNLPAKAGRPVLESFFRSAARNLSPDGTAAFVIVHTLAGFAREAAEKAGLETVFAEDAPRYAVMHLRAARQVQSPRPETDDDFAAYVRARASWSFSGASWQAETVHSLPDFDSLGHAAINALHVLSGLDVAGEALVWNPGQGHLPLFLHARAGPRVSLSIAARDCLELAICERNLRMRGAQPRNVIAVPWESELAAVLPRSAFDLLVAAPHPIPGVPWQVELLGAADALLCPRGRLLVTGTSTEMQRLLALRGPFGMVDGKKHAGYRALLLERR